MQRFNVLTLMLIFLVCEGGDCNPVLNEDTYAIVEGEDVDITCTSIDGAFYWMDRSPSALDYAFYSSRSDTVIPDLEYNNFAVLNPDATSSILRITGVTCDDSSIYICTLDPVAVDEFGDSALLNVSVKPALAVTAVDSANIVEGSSYQFVCTASNAYPAVSLSWEVNGISLSGSETGPNLTTDYRGGCDTYDTKSILMYLPNRTDTSVVCISSNQPLSNGLQEPLTIDVKYAPTCKINGVFFGNSFNSSGEVMCSCDANPTAAYTFYEDNNQVTTGVVGDTYSFDYDVPEGSKTTVIYCKGANSVGEDESEAVTITSIPGIATTEVPPTKGKNTGIATTEVPPTKGKTPGGGSNIGLIIGVLFAGIILIAIIVIIVVFLLKRSGHHEEQTNGVGMVTQGKGNVANDNSAYADLIHETTTEKTTSRSAFSEVPFQNIDLKSILGGKGIIEYWKATLMGSKIGDSVVVKKVSDEASVMLALYHFKELEVRQGFSSHGNVAELIGFSSTEVSKYILLEFCNNGTLKSLLLDNYDSEKVHTYGNIKKSLQVTAVGSPDKLSKFAQNIVDGMTFLVDNKCLHPGLSAKKVLLDRNLVCKLYDFVPEAIVTDRQRIVWGKKKMPYQWLAPEMLFLNDYSSAGDIWSLGVVLWEIFSFGMDPHKGKTQVEVEKILRNRGKLQMPTNCPGGMYQIMLDCWNHNAKERPTFHRLREKFLQFSSEGVYVEV